MLYIFCLNFTQMSEIQTKNIEHFLYFLKETEPLKIDYIQEPHLKAHESLCHFLSPSVFYVLVPKAQGTCLYVRYHY